MDTVITQSDHFISSPFLNTIFSRSGLKVFETEFDSNKYSKQLFSHFDVTFPEQLNRSVNKRQAEFLAGRIVAKVALESFGIFNQSITIGNKRSPIWPNKVIGSISHSNNKAICAMADRKCFSLLGIDHEDIIKLNLREISNHVLSCSEPDMIKSSDLSMDKAVTLVFSAKESLFKALFPIVRDYFDFSAAKVTSIDLLNNSFEIQLLETLHETLPNGTRFTGCFQLGEQNVTTLIVQ